MTQLNLPVLSIVTFLPLAGALLLLVLPRLSERAIKGLALAVSLVTFAVSLLLYAYFEIGSAAMQFTESVPWITELGISYQLGVDGISLWLVLLTTFLTPLAILSSWTAIKLRLKA
jgi:NADH-quinone oxidoreductase subunit M